MKPPFVVAVVMLITSPAVAAGASQSEMRAFAVWSKVVKEEFLFYRNGEDLLLEVEKLPPLEGNRYLKRRLHADLRPKDDVLAHVALDRYEDVDDTETCFQAIRFYQWAISSSKSVSSVTEKPFINDARGYLEQARLCEKALHLPPKKDKFREVIDVIPVPGK